MIPNLDLKTKVKEKKDDLDLLNEKLTDTHRTL